MAWPPANTVPALHCYLNSKRLIGYFVLLHERVAERVTQYIVIPKSATAKIQSKRYPSELSQTAYQKLVDKPTLFCRIIRHAVLLDEAPGAFNFQFRRVNYAGQAN